MKARPRICIVFFGMISFIFLMMVMSATFTTLGWLPRTQYIVNGKNGINIVIPSSSHSWTVTTNIVLKVTQSTRTSTPQTSKSAKINSKKMIASTHTTFTTKPTTFIKHNINIASTTINPEYEKAKKFFYIRITKTEKDAFRSLMKVFHETLFPNVTYFLHYGSLLGSYRNHGMIPWDDDLDLMVNNSHKPMLKKRLNALGSEYILDTRVTSSWKFTFKNSTRTRLGWNWPFLDIFFFTGNKTHIWTTHYSWKKFKFRKTIIFPLIKRPFMGMLLSAPNNGVKVLDTFNFNIDMCHSVSYDHKQEYYVGESAKIPCKLLWKDFSFVRLERKLNTTYEIMTDNEHVSVYDRAREQLSFL